MDRERRASERRLRRGQTPRALSEQISASVSSSADVTQGKHRRLDGDIEAPPPPPGAGSDAI